MNYSFNDLFFDWIDSSISQSVNPKIMGFCFNLSEPYNIEMVGSDTFNVVNSDWACNESFVPNPRGIDIPESICCGTWQECLEIMKRLTLEYLASNRIGAGILKSSKGVGIGFVDGDIDYIFINSK